MFELIGLIFGGVSRLAQHWMEMRDKQKEREHEAVMYDKQIELADKKFVHDSELRRMDAQAADAAAEWEAMRAAVEAQAREAQAAGGWVAKLSASIRPLLTVYHAIIIYTVVKVSLFWLAYSNGISWASAIVEIYGPFDKALCGSMVGFWFQDRALRRQALK
jgi:hypothetical protein